jgi:cytochrome c oxidase subunit 2
VEGFLFPDYVLYKIRSRLSIQQYEYADFLNEENETINFDSYMKDEASLEKGELRMLEVDNSVILPVDTHIRFIITAADVLHD